MAEWGRLYGVGAGPGASDLLTLRAVRILEEVPVLALPRSSNYGASVAWQIVKPVLRHNAAQQRLFLTFPMSKAAAEVAPHVHAAVDAIGEHLCRGSSVAFVTEGDPSLFSTFGYVRKEALVRWPQLSVEVVPGVCSINAVASVGQIALADGQERIAVLPATYGVEDLVQILAQFDTVVLMKIGQELPVITAALEQTGLLSSAFFVSKATMVEQRFVPDITQLGDERGGCFSMIIVKKDENSGLLLGKAALREARHAELGL